MEKIKVPDILRKATRINTIKLTEIKLGIDNKKHTYRTSNVLDLKVFVLDFSTKEALKKSKKVNNISEKSLVEIVFLKQPFIAVKWLFYRLFYIMISTRYVK